MVTAKKDMIPGDLPEGLSGPAVRALLNEKITTLRKLSKLTEAEILRLHGMGQASMPLLRSALKKKKLSFKTEKKSAGGAYTHYHADGSVWAKGKIIAGKMDGYWEWFRKDGSLMRSGHFKKGVQVGEWATYDKSGNTVKTTTMS